MRQDKDRPRGPSRADLHRNPEYREQVNDHLERAGQKLEKQDRPEVQYLGDGRSLSEVFRNEAARQKQDRDHGLNRTQVSDLIRQARQHNQYLKDGGLPPPKEGNDA